MQGLNKVMLLGYLGKKPIPEEISDFTVCRIRLATHWKNNKGDLLTEWHSVVFFNKLAEIVGKYCHQGDSIFVEGYLKTRQWLDNSAVTHYTTEIVASQMQFVSSKKTKPAMQANESETNNYTRIPYSEAPPHYSEAPHYSEVPF